MGYEVHRFIAEVDEELICVICGGVLEDAVMAEACEHSFCKSCIETWLGRQNTCPVDRSSLHRMQLKPVPRIMRNMLSRLELKCDNLMHGCTMNIPIDRIEQHLAECEFNPKKPVLCQHGCRLLIPKDEVSSHNCINELHLVIKKQGEEIEDLRKQCKNHTNEQNQQRQDISSLRQELCLLKEYLKSLKGSSKPSTSLQVVEQRIQNDEIARWTQTLTAAIVMRWGGVISTPDAVLQTIIRRALIDTRCPMHIVNELMENAHERRWPTGLSTLETRQLNRTRYDSYITKKIPGKQAIVILQCENRHMDDDLILSPGIVIIFAHGIEDTNVRMDTLEM